METGPRRSTALPTQLLSMNSRADLYYWNAPCNIWFVALFMYTAATFLSPCTSRRGCTTTLLLPHASLVYVSRSDKKDSCGALYFEKVSSLSMEGTQPLSVSCCWFYLSSPGRQPFLLVQDPVHFFKNSLRKKDHCNSNLGLAIQPNNKKRMAAGEGQGQDYCIAPMTVKLFRDVLLKIDLL